MSSKAATIASLVRVAARTEEEFQTTVQSVIDDADADRTAEFFDRLNIPRSTGGERLTDPLPAFNVKPDHVTTFTSERTVSDGMQKFLDRHERKIKWHATHPGLEGVQNVILLFRCGAAVTELRLQRLQALMRAHDELTPVEWSIARDLTNHAYLTFKNYLQALSNEWVDAMLQSTNREEFGAAIGNFYEIVDGMIRNLEEHRRKIEERRQELTVVPEGYPPVKPPNYFGGDMMGSGPWTQFWNGVMTRAHHFREAVG